MPDLGYDPFSPEVMADPWPFYARLREQSPVHYLERWDCWALSRFEDLWNAAADDEHFMAGRGTSTAHLLTKVMPVSPMIGVMDPPDHTRLRAAVRGFFAPKRVHAFEPRIRGWVREYLDRVRGRGSADLVEEFAKPVAAKVACLVAGYPIEHGEHLGELVHRFFARVPGHEGMTPDGLAALQEMGGYFAAMVRERRKRPIDEPDILGALLPFETGGRRYADEELASHLAMFLIGGAETFPKVFASAIYWLWRHPDQRAELAADSTLAVDAFNETLRFDMPTQTMMRTLRSDFTLHGKLMKASQPVIFLFPSGNRDPREFREPDRFWIRRRAPRMLGFGAGTHACLGIHIARLEGRIALEEVLAVMPRYEIEESGLEHYTTEFVRGISKLPVRFAPA
jgi:cytochrome P450